MTSSDAPTPAGPDQTPTHLDQTPGQLYEAVAIFHDAPALQSAMDELLNSGFDRAELSIMAGDETARAKLGGTFDHVDEAKHDPTAPRTVFVTREELGAAQGVSMGVLGYLGAVLAGGVVVATGGAAAAAIAAALAAGGAGAGVGAVLARWLGQEHGGAIEAQIEKGGLLLWVTLRNAEREPIAREILGRLSHEPVEVHRIDMAAGHGVAGANISTA